MMKHFLGFTKAGRQIAAPAFSLFAALLCASPAIAQKAVCDVHAYGAKADGKTKDTKAIQAAIDDCAKKGGGIVKLSGGAFLSTPLVLKSNVTLDIAKGSTLLGSPDHEDYTAKIEFREKGRQPLISASNAENIVITGGGVIDGNGESWWKLVDKNNPNPPADRTRPRLVVFEHCKHIKMENITVQNSPSWQVVPYYSDDLVFRNIRVLAPETSHNTDGIDPFASTNIVIDHAYIDTGDDNIAIKSGQPGSSGGDSPSKNITITNCTCLRGHGLSIGSEIAGGVQNVRAERIHFKGTSTGIRVKSNRDRGNDIGNFLFRDIKMEDVNTAILLSAYYPKIPQGEDAPQPVTALTPHFHDFTIENLEATGSKVAGIVIGLPEAPIKNLQFKNVKISAVRGMTVSFAEITGSGLKISAEKGEALHIGSGATGNLK